jgi:hypothetical protein
MARQGFYMATEKSDAEYFAARRIGGGSVIIVDINYDVLEELRSLGAVAESNSRNPSAVFCRR